MARGQNWEEHRKFWGFSANPYTDTLPITTSTTPRNTPVVLLSPRIYIPVQSPTSSLVQKAQIEVIKLGNVVMRSKPTGSPSSAHTPQLKMSPLWHLVLPCRLVLPYRTISSGPTYYASSLWPSQHLHNAGHSIWAWSSQSKHRECECRHQQHLMLHRQAANSIMWEYPSLDSYVVISDKCLGQAYQEALGESTKTRYLHLHPDQLVHFHPNSCGPIPSSAFYFPKPQDSLHPVADNDTSAPGRRSKNQPDSQSSRRPESQTTSGLHPEAQRNLCDLRLHKW